MNLKRNGWVTIFPRAEQEWYHLHNLISVALISEWLHDNYRKSRVKAISIMGDDQRRWRLTTEDSVRRFLGHIGNSFSTGEAGKCKVRIEMKKRHHRLP